jgi:hypothetical protein
LRADHPRLAELRARYAAHPIGRGHSAWTDQYLAREVRLPYFRGDNAYIWQTRAIAGESPLDPAVKYLLTSHYCQDIDALGCWSRLDEDGQFGVLTFPFKRRRVSRDLLDSILELNFLERHIGISRMAAPTVLDIGAGYGRLGHRLAQALPQLRYALCTDGVAMSTFLCEYYLRFRGVTDRVRAIPLDEIEETLRVTPIDIVTNIESFSECTIRTIDWWIDLIATAGVTYLLVQPNYRDALESLELDGSKLDFRPVIESHGFDLVASESIYRPGDDMSKFGLYPDRAHVLFRNRNATRR